MILEGLVTTRCPQGDVNLSPMGPEFVEGIEERFLLKPYQTSRTYRNLVAHGQGVFHVTDDVELLARAAVQQEIPLPPLRPADKVEGWILEDCCRWYAFVVDHCETNHQRARLTCRIVESGRVRDFLGINRALFAVVEAAILATRVAFLPHREIHQQLDHLRVIVEKTAGPREQRAFAFLDATIRAAAEP